MYPNDLKLPCFCLANKNRKPAFFVVSTKTHGTRKLAENSPCSLDCIEELAVRVVFVRAGEVRLEDKYHRFLTLNGFTWAISSKMY